MNRIENEWQHLKSQELGGQMFEDEYDLALAVMDGVEARGLRKGHVTERFKFNCAAQTQVDQDAIANEQVTQTIFT